MKFPKGNKLAPGGRRKGSGRKPDALKAEMQAVIDSSVSESDRANILKKMVAEAVAGNVKAAALVLGYVWGKPVERKELTGAEGGVLTVKLEGELAQWGK